MARLTIVYECGPRPPLIIDRGGIPELEMSVALLEITNDLGAVDLYDVARRLAELLLEQRARLCDRGVD